jgi:hypothetical protein
MKFKELILPFAIIFSVVPATAQLLSSEKLTLQERTLKLFLDQDSLALAQLMKDLPGVTSPIIRPINAAVKEIQSRYYAQLLNTNQSKIIETASATLWKVDTIVIEKQKDDYQRLLKLLKEHQPKFQINSKLLFHLNENREVCHISIKNKKKLSPDKASQFASVINTLKEHKCVAHESMRIVSSEQFYHLKTEQQILQENTERLRTTSRLIRQGKIKWAK